MENKILFIDKKIEILLKYKKSEQVNKYPEYIKASISYFIGRCYLLESSILKNKKFKENIDNQFFTAQAAVNRHYREWGLDEVGDIYNEIRLIALYYMEKEEDN